MKRAFISLIYVLLSTFNVAANEAVQLSLSQWQADAIHANGVEVELGINQQGFLLKASANQLVLAEPIGLVSEVKMSCPRLKILAEQYRCSQGSLRFIHPKLGQQQVRFSLKAKPKENVYQLIVSDLSLASSKVEIKASLEQDDWRAEISIPSAKWSKIRQFVMPYLNEKQKGHIDEWTLTGNLKSTTTLSGHNTFIHHVEGKLSTQIDGSDVDGHYAGEGVQLHSQFELAQLQQDVWQWQLNSHFDKGQSYVEPIYIDFSETALSLVAKGQWNGKNSYLDVEHATIKQRGIADLTVGYKGHLNQVDALQVTVEPTDIALFYQSWLQPFLLETSLAELKLNGAMLLSYQQQKNDDYHARLTLKDLGLSDQQQRFSISGLSGVMAWSNFSKVVRSDFHWDSASVYKLALGASQVNVLAQNSTITLSSPWQLPILDGELQLDEFTLSQLENEQITWSFNGLLTLISMVSLSSALVWPKLQGKLSGVIPKLSYVDQHITTEGALMINVFDGTMILRDLALEAPFGVLPQLSTNIDIINLDLETLSETFDFGKITGKLAGKVGGLQLSDWRPVAFDARFATPDDDDSRHRISQKAIDSLSQLGGGPTGFVSRSFLRFFEDFSYQTIGLNCRLQNNICEMSGVEAAEQGYYIVKGSLLPPRINVVGHTQQVDWSDLVERLKAVSNSSGPIVQ